uniref:Reverse transcriptase RNase H-like domain-containing protein n=1 Tax=Romanomermis culicivorax TaxID=13658 RepID=A0A915KNV1_ROMCU
MAKEHPKGCFKAVKDKDVISSHVMEYFHLYLFQHEVIMQIDHTTVKASLKKPNFYALIARLGFALVEFKLSFHTQKGPANDSTNASSCLPKLGARATHDMDDAFLHRPEGNFMMIQ